MTDTNTEHRPNATSDASQKPLSGFDGLVHRLGADKTLGLVERLGGTTIRVPVGLQQRPLEQFAKTVGNMHLAKLLVQHYGGTSLYLSSRTAARKLLRNSVHMSGRRKRRCPGAFNWFNRDGNSARVRPV